MTINNGARIHAREHWNAQACGEMEGDKNSIEYFQAVESERYGLNSWITQLTDFTEYSDQKILEIGVGQGTDLIEFAKAGAECFGADITDNHLILTKRNFDLHGFHVELVKADAVRLPFPDGYFDCIYSVGVLHHIPEITDVIEEIRRVLRPGGELIFALYNKWSAFHIFQKIIANGLRNGWLFTKGYSGLLATIESGADGVNVKPYVRLYSKRELRRHLLQNWEINELSVRHLQTGHFWPSLLSRWVGPFIPVLEKYAGWYVTCKARKATDSLSFRN